MESWRPVVGYEGLYAVSNLGRVRSLERTVTFVNGSVTRTRTFPSTVLVLCENGHGRLQFRPSRSGKAWTVMVHKAVAEAFHGPRPTGLVVNHKDGNKKNNRADNLEWVTLSENSIHAQNVLGKGHGSQQGSSKLTENQVRDIRRRYIRGTGLHNRGNGRALCIEYGISPSSLSNIILRKSWRRCQ